MDKDNLTHILQVKTGTFKGILMKHTTTKHILLITTIMLVPTCYPKCMVMKPPFYHNQNACGKIQYIPTPKYPRFLSTTDSFDYDNSMTSIAYDMDRDLAELRQTPMAPHVPKISSIHTYTIHPW